VKETNIFKAIMPVFLMRKFTKEILEEEKEREEREKEEKYLNFMGDLSIDIKPEGKQKPNLDGIINRTKTIINAGGDANTFEGILEKIRPESLDKACGAIQIYVMEQVNFIGNTKYTNYILKTIDAAIEKKNMGLEYIQGVLSKVDNNIRNDITQWARENCTENLGIELNNAPNPKLTKQQAGKRIMEILTKDYDLHDVKNITRSVISQSGEAYSLFLKYFGALYKFMKSQGILKKEYEHYVHERRYARHSSVSV
jgi:hypothetical protein